jgi:signal transduction histidine kinase
MGQAVDILNYVNLALYSIVALVALREWRAGRGRAGLWAALTFGSLAFVVDVGALLPEHERSTSELVAVRLIIAVLVLFPYLLYRFTTTFEPSTKRLERLVGVMTVIVLAWTFALPRLPEAQEPQPTWFRLYVLAFTIHWTLLTVVVAWRFWRAGRGQSSVARRRMYLLGLASAAITVALIVVASNPDETSWVTLAATLLSTLSALLFLVGLAPPPSLRLVWRRPETRRTQEAIADLMGATSAEDIAARVLEPMAGLVAARAVALEDNNGRIVGTFGDASALEDESRVEHVEFTGGKVHVAMSAYAPFFGGEELTLLRTLGALTGLALDRSELFAREVETRRALERADELKTNFVALAAHELRNPVATIVGLAQTLNRVGDRLPEEQRTEVIGALDRQGTRLHLLVEQLLDLSRLDAEAVTVEPQRLQVRERVEQIAHAAAAEHAGEVDVQIAEDLETNADPVVLDRVVSNLVVNAFRYGAAPVVVRAERSDNHFRLTVEDSGAGVAPEFVPDLFERFTRSDGTRERQGTGLGLAIARSYARAHAGDLLYEPGHPRGSRFQLVLPAKD